MGQYLAIGIITEIAISKSGIAKAKSNITDVFEKLQNELLVNTSLFDCREDEKHHFLNLKTDVLKMFLIPLVEKIFPVLHGQKISDNLVAELNNTPSETWLELANRKKHCEFQFDEYGEHDTLYIGEPFPERLRVNYDSIMLSAEGKIMMEEYGRQFKFFKYAISQWLSDNPLSGALRIYITG